MSKFKASEGFSLVEAILSVAVFALIVTAVAGAFLYGQDSSAVAGNRIRAAFLADEALEGVRNIRDNNFSDLVAGSYGLVSSGGQYSLRNGSDQIGIFERQTVISDIDGDRKKVSVNVFWPQNLQRDGSLILVTYFTNWRDFSTLSDCSSWCQGLGYGSGTCRVNPQQCIRHNEVYESEGGQYCLVPANLDTCCCLP